MENTFKWFGIVVLVAVIGFSMAACDTGTTGGGRDGLPPAGDGGITFPAPGDPNVPPPPVVVDFQGNPVPADITMNFTRVAIGWDEDDVIYAYLLDIIPGSAITLSGGTLSFRLGNPIEAELMSAAGTMPPGFSATPGLRIFMVGLIFYTTESVAPRWMIPPDDDEYSLTVVQFVYADRAGTVSGRFQNEYWNETANWVLRQGWNTVISTITFDDPDSGSGSSTSVTGTPGANFRWMIF
ncbi:MAG: hypothetical protein FWC64_07815 [Treponema sp.]|nr:hypothetical protein [Treponema sp.]